MQNQNPQQTTTTTTDIKSLRLPANYGATLGVKKLLTNVPVGRPRKDSFFRTHSSPDMTFSAMILENKDARESYVVVPEVAQQISELVRPVMLHAAIDRQNNVSLIPVPLPGENGTRNPWHESLAQAVEHAKEQWIRIAATKRLCRRLRWIIRAWVMNRPAPPTTQLISRYVEDGSYPIDNNPAENSIRPFV